MRDIDASILAELQASELRPFMLLNMTIDGTSYFRTDCDIPLYFGGNKYHRLGFRPDAASYGVQTIVDQCTIEIDIVDQVLISAFVGGTPQGSDIGLQMVVLDDSHSIIGSEAFTLFSGEIDNWELDPDDKIRVTMTNIFTRWNQRTLALHSSSCRWKEFKGLECGYVGSETTCDRTYRTCNQTYGNADNFGGFRWLPSLEDAVIWWGRSPGYEE